MGGKNIGKSMKLEIRLLIFGICLGISGCGYHFSFGKPPEGIAHIAVLQLENRSGEIGAESIISNDLIYELNRNGMLSNADSADAFLSGVIRSAGIETISRRNINSSLQRRIRFTVDLTLKNKSDRIIWSKNSIQASETYDVMPDISATEWNKRNAIAVLSKRLAETAYQRLTDDF